MINSHPQHTAPPKLNRGDWADVVVRVNGQRVWGYALDGSGYVFFEHGGRWWKELRTVAQAGVEIP